MKAFKIPDWLGGTKIRCCQWHAHAYIYFNGECWKCDETESGGDYKELIHIFAGDEWEPFEEPRKVALYRYTYKLNKIVNRRCIAQGMWTTDLWNDYSKDDDFELLKTETKEVEIEND